jgi:U6 snRNA-associated Sm-like protein LSm8
LTRQAAALSFPSLQGRAFFTRDRLNLTMSLQSYIDRMFCGRLVCSVLGLIRATEKVLIITVDGRTLVGTLLSCDQVTNIVLNDTVERIIRPADDPEPSSEVSHGLYLVRGDNITIVGLVDQELDNSIDWEKVRGEVIGTTKHV